MLFDLFRKKQKNRDRDRGDRYRDVKDWANAAEAYAQHLRDDETDQAIWVQYGHSLKEQERLEEAEAAYQTAMTLDPQDRDVYLHHADVQRRLARSEASPRSDDQRADAIIHLEADGFTRQILFASLRLAPYYIDCDDQAFVRHAHVAGLQREPLIGASIPPAIDGQDVYRHRVDYLHLILSSEEARLTGYNALLSAIPKILGSGNRPLMAGMIKSVFPTMPDLRGGLETLLGHARDNSRRQDMILASITKVNGVRGNTVRQ